jgi:hypothetical protein
MANVPAGEVRAGSDPFPDYFAVQAHAEANDLEVAWEGSPVFRKWRRKLSPGQFEVRAVLRTHKGPTRVGLFSKEFVRAEWRENQERLAAKREARQRNGWRR